MLLCQVTQSSDNLAIATALTQHFLLVQIAIAGELSADHTRLPS